MNYIPSNSIIIVSLLLCIYTFAHVQGQVCNLQAPNPIHKFSICTMVHNEAKYVEEWVAYHLLIKADHMYIYNDESSDDIEQVLAPYIKQGYVTLVQWNKLKQTVNSDLVPNDPPYTRAQRFALADCVYNHRNESEWFGIWDVDEFVVLNSSYSDLHVFIDSIKDKLDNYLIPLTVFGSSGYEATPNGLVVENYKWRSNYTLFGFDAKTNKFSGKSLYSAQCSAPNVHFTNTLREGCKQHYKGWAKADGVSTHLPITMNHYATKSWEHFVEKMRKWNWGVSDDLKNNIMENDNNYYDDNLVKFASRIRELESCMAKFN